MAMLAFVTPTGTSWSDVTVIHPETKLQCVELIGTSALCKISLPSHPPGRPIGHHTSSGPISHTIHKLVVVTVPTRTFGTSCARCQPAWCLQLLACPYIVSDRANSLFSLVPVEWRAQLCPNFLSSGFSSNGLGCLPKWATPWTCHQQVERQQVERCVPVGCMLPL